LFYPTGYLQLKRFNGVFCIFEWKNCKFFASKLKVFANNLEKDQNESLILLD